MTQTEMRGLSLFGLSPLAIAYGAKTIETRTWKPPESAIGERIAIHTSKSRPPGGLYELGLWMMEEQNQAWLQTAGLVRQNGDGLVAYPEEVPVGVIVCTAVIKSVLPTEQLAPLVSDLEWSHGDYTPGRYGWVLEKVLRLKEPVPHIGAQQLWKVDEEALPLVSGRMGTRVKPISSPISSDRPTPRRFSR